MHNPKYEKWVKSLPCAITQDDTATDCHHLKGDQAGMILKANSFFSIPLCREVHDDLHHVGFQAWELKHGVTQWELACKTMARAVFEGVLRIEI